MGGVGVGVASEWSNSMLLQNCGLPFIHQRGRASEERGEEERFEQMNILLIILKPATLLELHGGINCHTFSQSSFMVFTSIRVLSWITWMLSP